MKYKIITIGGATRDITFITDQGLLIDNHKDLLRQKLLAFEYGAKIKVDDFHNLFGGGAANAAVNFASSGFKTACLARVGTDDSGREIIANLRERKVSTELVEADSKASTGLSCILVAPEGERIIFTNRSANNDLVVSRTDMSLLKSATWLYIASLSGKWQNDLKKIFAVSGPKIAWNPGSSQYQAGLAKLSPFLKKTSVLSLNNDEAMELVMSDKSLKNKPASFFKNIKNLLRHLHSVGPEMVLITSGSKGADVYDGHTFYHQDILKEKKRVDITGVGDAFSSSFVIGLELTKGDIQKSLYLGVKNTAAKISHLGAQNGLLDLRKLIKKSK